MISLPKLFSKVSEFEFRAVFAEFPRDFPRRTASEVHVSGRHLQQQGTPEPSCHIGCFTDNFTLRALPRKMSSSGNQTVESCQAAAITKNVSMFALEYGVE